jgi:hypothetical protein
VGTPRKTPAKRRCKGTNKAGERCGAAPLKGSDYCRAHDPDVSGSARFGSHEQAKAAGDLGGRPKAPRVVDVMRERVEEDVDRILVPYFDALEGAVVHATFEGEVLPSDHPDIGARIAAAEKLLDRVYGRPKQALEHAGPDGSAIRTEDAGAIDPSKLNRQQRAALREILDAQGG